MLTKKTENLKSKLSRAVTAVKRQNEITDDDEVISGGNEKITYQQIEFLQKKIVYPSFDTQHTRNKCIADI